MGRGWVGGEFSELWMMCLKNYKNSGVFSFLGRGSFWKGVQ